ncbi:helix-turn-helix domain-containing protein [Mycobacterium sp. SMC-14]|uniref:helix-turn-helix domain-containing protein n=1 Tax=Mycobacterium sp. SMC-14 TaxID=3385968 RepID=UPI00390CBB21
MMEPQLFRPRPPLSESIAYFGYWDRRGAGPHRSRALPRGAATIVIDIGERPEVDFFGADACTRVSVPPAFFIGAGTASYVTQIDTAQTVITVHFRSGGAWPFVGIAQGELTDACVGLGELWGREAVTLRQRLAEASSAAARVKLLEALLMNRLQDKQFALHGDVTAVLDSAERNPSMRVRDAVALTGSSPKRLINMFRAQVGLTPKAYLRVRRLQAALTRLDSGAARGAALAAELGYFDQAHFVREFRAFTATTPTQYLRRRSWLAGHVDLVEDSPTTPRG